VSLKTFWSWFNRPTCALPLDIFRALVGAVELVFFISLIRELPDFSSPGGLIDHQFSAALFPFTRYTLVPANAGSSILALLFLFGCVCCCALIVGYRPKLAAGIAYAILVSTYRRNFLVMYVDDSIVHLMLFWLLLLPIGRTLNLRDWFTHGSHAWQRWQRESVPGGTLRCFVWNVALVYIVSGLWKWTSPMWRDGAAVYTVFKMPIAYQFEFWGPQHFTILAGLNYLTLVMEPVFPFLTFWRRGHPVKYALAAGAAGFHLIMLATLMIPFANLACLAALVILLRSEVSNWLGAIPSQAAIRCTRTAMLSAIALVFTIVLTSAMLSEAAAPEWRGPAVDSTAGDRPVLGIVNPGARIMEHVHDGLLKLLWAAGIAQEYQLFNWIDYRNFRFDYQIWEHRSDFAPQRIEASAMFPMNLRGLLLQSYLHGVTWTSIPADRLTVLKETLSERLARRYCRRYQPSGDITVYSSVVRIDPRRPDNETDPHRLLLSFRCRGAEPVMDSAVD
jgi:hypothetical protein